MTFEKLLYDLSNKSITPKEAYEIMSSPEKMKTMNYYSHIDLIQKDPLSDSQIQELSAIVNILQTLYNSNVDSPISDYNYDSLQELLVNNGIPGLTGSIEINDNAKLSHNYTTMRGTLDKVYYLYPDEPRVNKSRKYLHEWVKRMESLYEQRTGKHINLEDVKVMLQPKFDGASAVLEYVDKPLWISRGDTRNNRASDVSHIMNIFNDIYAKQGTAVKFEVMMTEENKDKINQLVTEPYRNSRQVVTATLNSNEADFKAEYLYPVPLRIIHDGEEVEQIHPKLIENFPTKVCKLGDRDAIKSFAKKYVEHNGMRFRTDGVVITILDPTIQRVLGRDDNINNFEVAYKFTEEEAISRVKDVEFYVSEFGFITPVLVVNDVILKGNTVNHISLSNKERFDELNLSYGDEVKVLYDIIPYATIDSNCHRVTNGRKIEFVDRCPKCHEKLNLNAVQVQCVNPKCPSRIIGRVLNYCRCLRIQNIGYQTLESLYYMRLLDNGIRSLYKLKKKVLDIEMMDGFGKLKTRKMISEVEAKRRLKDYEFFGAIGIEGLSMKTFELIFKKIPLDEFLNMINLKNYNLLLGKLITIKGIGKAKAEIIVDYFKDKETKDEFSKLLKEVILTPTYGIEDKSKGTIVFSGCRPDNSLANELAMKGYKVSDSWINSAKYLVVPNRSFESSKVGKAKSANVPIITLSEINSIGGSI